MLRQATQRLIRFDPLDHLPITCDGQFQEVQACRQMIERRQGDLIFAQEKAIIEQGLKPVVETAAITAAVCSGTKTDIRASPFEGFGAIDKSVRTLDPGS